MSDYFNANLDDLIMPSLDTDEYLFDHSFWDDPGFIGQPFDCDDLALPGVPRGPQELSTVLPMHSACSEKQATPSLTHPLHGANPLPEPVSASTPEHAPVSTEAINECIECGETFKTKSDLNWHGNRLRHDAFACTCGTRFSRSDVLTRHLKTKNNARPLHPCPFCKRHRGKSAFHRKDHLKQHIEEYHKLDFEEHMPKRGPTRASVSYYAFGCHVLDCPDYRGVHFYRQNLRERKATAPFTKYSEYNKHLKTAHETTRFPCPADGCDRVGVKGYQREKDLANHHRLMHPDRPSYLPEPGARAYTIPCPYPDCAQEIDAQFPSFYLHEHPAA